MSVINKMLRDLDQRQTANRAVSSVTVPAPHAALRRGTASVSSAASLTAPRSRWAGWLALVVLVVALALAGWWLQTAGPLAARVSPVVAAPAPAVVVAPAPVAAASVPAAQPVAAELQPPVPTPLAATPVAAPATVVPVTLSRPPAATGGDTPAVASASKTRPAPAPAPMPASPMVLRMEPSLAPRKAASSGPSTPAAVPPVPEATPVAQRQQQAGGDAIAQAQSLWNAGSRDAAIDLMQQSVAAAERAAKAGANPGSAAGGTPLLVLLVREMARMQMAEARYGAVWEGLSRLEPLLGNQPDLWALRANAAQRLGRHQDSVHAYMAALQSRPNEQRWMLGAAVSLAALGQTGSAADMAERARAAGPISRDVLTYLRQMGVPVKDQ